MLLQYFKFLIPLLAAIVELYLFSLFLCPSEHSENKVKIYISILQASIGFMHALYITALSLLQYHNYMYTVNN